MKPGGATFPEWRLQPKCPTDEQKGNFDHRCLAPHSVHLILSDFTLEIMVSTVYQVMC